MSSNMATEQSEPTELSMSGYPVSIRALNETEKVIGRRFGDFNDFPSDLANTLANIVYLSVLCVVCNSDRDLMPCLLPYMEPNLKKLLVGSRSSGAISAMRRSRLELTFMAEAMKLMIKGPHYFEFLEEVIPRTRESFRKDPGHAFLIYSGLLDGLKYGIDRPSSKPSWQRAMLRKIAKVRELPDLVDLLQKRTMFRYYFCDPRSIA